MAEWTSMMPSASIAAFAESLVEGRRVLLLGSSGNNLWQKLLERGARLVHVCDPDPVRLAEAAARSTTYNASFAPFSNQAALALRDSVFDFAIIDNLAAFADPADALRTLRKSLSPRGVAFVTAPNPDVRESLLPDVAPSRGSLDYYSLYDAVRAQFPIVRMLGQMPFVGYTVAELAPQDDPEPTIDAGFVPGGTEEPEWFVAAASAHPFEINAFTVVQVPVTEVLHHSSERQLREQLRVSRNAERSAVERLARLEAQQIDQASRAAEAKDKEETYRQLTELRSDLRSREDRIIALEAKVVASEARLSNGQGELERMRQSLAQAERAEVERAALARNAEAERAAIAQTAEAERITAAERAEAERAALARNAETERVTAAERAEAERAAHARNAEAERASLAQQASAAADRAKIAEELAAEAATEIARFETQLRDRGARIRQLEAELKAAERVGQQLLRDLEAARQGQHRQFGNEAWSIGGGTLPKPLTADTTQLSGTTSAWVAPQVDSPAEVPSPVLQAEAARIVGERARLQADLIAAKWRVDQLQFVIERNRTSEELQEQLKLQLREAQARVNEQAALLSQLESASIRS